ncbi:MULTISPECIES: asparagine synthase (glutamine-hydrolyzing) [unclassified Paenibacillus]|uniref:asparagine synthase (glutamine-hydrolyzing) n=1 Tax=unclassified Paenibacillus TaxID=185978 RepID=UPI0009A618FA|nr:MULTISPECIES: asparagine synthase (glutamine-hydrolyzing) [unclassified Paenibacillus]SLK20213.1 asparagine synthase (glutamine-hydrolysing) [Paenibacillus sp. RU5A]SOC76105.1 asparagine synthase (glutamine-hydrolysing) [Paenibacillus sp. RU26A]SOC77800.1 asparagine synthase (glutamine-hydrolysing) [Paenibacillus sp. RU5M]
MCGICGVYNMRFKEQVIVPGTLEQMTQVLHHRGPDDHSKYIGNRVAFGFTRLSLMDWEHGQQPFSNEDGTVIAICNGEIFNYESLKSSLQSEGHVLHTKCDMEIIPHLYEKYGMKFMQYINGQFAIALYDSVREEMYLIRDQAGICPVFYAVNNDDFIFGSEIKSILHHPSVERKVDLVALDQLLTFPSIIAPRTLFHGISSLESGHYLHITGNRMEKVQYWDLVYPKSHEIEDSLCEEQDYIEELDHIFSEAVGTRLTADFPVGLYVSGGLDSSMIALKASQLSPSARKSFSVTFADKSMNESIYQKLVVDEIKSEHFQHEFDIRDITEHLKSVVWHSETALKESYNTASYMLSKLVNREGIKAVLTGEGADELFAGYVGYRFDQFNAKKGTQSIAEEEVAIRERLWGDGSFFYERDYSQLRQLKLRLYGEKILPDIESIDCLRYPVISKEKIADIHLLHKRSYIDFKLRLPEHLLAGHGDRMAYAHSVEARYPFLDYKLMEFVSRKLPPHLKLKGFNEKYILKEIARSMVPNEIIKRPKFAFVAPGSPDLIREADEYLINLLSKERLKKQGYFNPDFVHELVEQYSRNDFRLNLPYESDILIIIITFCVFLDVFDMPDL